MGGGLEERGVAVGDRNVWGGGKGKWVGCGRRGGGVAGRGKMAYAEAGDKDVDGFASG